LEVDAQALALKVTPQGELAALGDADVSRDVTDHFAQVLLDGTQPENAFEQLMRTSDTQPQAQAPAGPEEVVRLQSPALSPVEGEMGQGPLGRVRAARFGELGRMVALKEYKPLWEALPWLSREELARRVRREAQAQAQLDHPCVLTILEVRGDDPQVVMPMAAGTLRDKLSRGGD